MSYAFVHRDGREEEDPPLSRLDDLLDELREHENDVEHGSVAVLFESSALEVYRRGLMVFTPNLEADVVEQFHLECKVDRDLVEVMRDLAEGRLAEVRALPWHPRNL